MRRNEIRLQSILALLNLKLAENYNVDLDSKLNIKNIIFLLDSALII